MHVRAANDAEKLRRRQRDKGGVILVRVVRDGANGWVRHVSESKGGRDSGRGGGTGPAQLGEAAARRRSAGEKWPMGQNGRKRGRGKNSFSFSKAIFQIHFQKILNSFFRFDPSHTIQKKQCSSMNATTCILTL